MKNPVGTAALIVNDCGEYLLHLRDNIPGIDDPGTWSLIGGNRENEEETPAQAIRREVKEEIGLDLPDLEPFVIVNTVSDDDPDQTAAVFTARWSGNPDTLTLTEGVMIRWFPIDMLYRLRMCPWADTVIHEHWAAYRPRTAS